MDNVKSRRTAGKSTVTKQDFARLLQGRFDALGIGTSITQSQSIFEAVLDEIRQQVKNGNRVLVSDFGFFYPKKMRPRKVKGGILPESFEQPYHIPAKTKIGFSSTPTGDKTVSRRL